MRRDRLHELGHHLDGRQLAIRRSLRARQRCREFVERGDGLVECEALKPLRDTVDRAMNGSLEFCVLGFGLGGACGLLASLDHRVDETPHPLQVPRCGLDSARGPFDVPLRRAVRQDEPPRGVSPVGLDDVSRVDNVLLGFRHLDRWSDGDGTTVTGLESSVRPRDDIAGRQPATFAVVVGFVAHHPLGEQRRERLARRFRQVTGQMHGPGEEPRIEQMEDRVLDPADVLVDVHPVVDRFRHRWRVCVRCREANEIPAGIDKGVHRVRLALRHPPANRAWDVAPALVPFERIAAALETYVLRQDDGQVFLFLGDGSAVFAVHDRDRATPVPLPGDTPVSQTEHNLWLAQTGFLDPAIDLGLRLLDLEPVEEPGIDHPSRPEVRLVANLEGCGVDVRRADDRNHVQVIFPSELEVATVMGRAPENRAGPVSHQHEIGDEYRKLHAFEKRMKHPNLPCGNPFFPPFQCLLPRPRRGDIPD